jgi:hypothetical protein
MGRNNPYEKTGAGPDTFDYYYLVRIHGKHQRESSRTTASGSIEITYSFKDRTTLTITRNRDGSGSRTVVEPNGQRRTRNYPNPHTRSNGTTGGGVNLRLRKMTLKMAATNMLVATQLHDRSVQADAARRKKVRSQLDHRQNGNPGESDTEKDGSGLFTVQHPRKDIRDIATDPGPDRSIFEKGPGNPQLGPEAVTNPGLRD